MPRNGDRVPTDPTARTQANNGGIVHDITGVTPAHRRHADQHHEQAAARDDENMTAYMQGLDARLTNVSGVFVQALMSGGWTDVNITIQNTVVTVTFADGYERVTSSEVPDLWHACVKAYTAADRAHAAHAIGSLPAPIQRMERIAPDGGPITLRSAPQRRRWTAYRGPAGAAPAIGFFGDATTRFGEAAGRLAALGGHTANGIASVSTAAVIALGVGAGTSGQLQPQPAAEPAAVAPSAPGSHTEPPAAPPSQPPGPRPDRERDGGHGHRPDRPPIAPSPTPVPPDSTSGPEPIPTPTPTPEVTPSALPSPTPAPESPAPDPTAEPSPSTYAGPPSPAPTASAEPRPSADSTDDAGGGSDGDVSEPPADHPPEEPSPEPSPVARAPEDPV
ncbi:hypothetical protein DFJ69_5762 [Thermomonospora umbrina]|uniref:Uncharacterized protein n=1 Tax=Thermomonospora umbrina TaxID=111806 RepID=A0A3D9T1N1_9ACTN|nr:hypothetical protein DFJ69_5762 [Thermomonospora umbrina]